jgi:short-subunit dehydrogenase
MGQGCRASKRCGALVFHYAVVPARSPVFGFAHGNSRDTNSVMAKPIPFFKDKVVLVTGASSGIGEEMARQLGRSGAKLTLAARRKERLENLARTIAESGGVPPLIVECDVTRDGDLERAIAETTRKWGKLDVAIANAGFGVSGPLKKLSLKDYQRQFETNVFGVLRTIYAALPELEKSRGNLAIIGSVAGWISSAGASPYSMSKFAVRALANAITRELKPAGVTVTLISPGFVISEIRQVDNQGRLRGLGPATAPHPLAMKTEPAVHDMLRAVARGKREQIITGHGKFFVALDRFFPWVTRAVGERVSARADKT